MSTTDADAILALAASTALPGETPHRETDDTTPSPRPFTRSQALSAGLYPGATLVLMGKLIQR